MAGAPDRGTVAVVIPMYNAAETIERTLQSVRAQTYADLDIVVVDDGSGDRGPELVMSVAARDPRVRLVRQGNGGVAEARNHGAALTTAPYLAFVDADDLWAPEKVAAQMALIAGGPPALAYCWFCQIDRRDRVYRPSYRPPSYEGDVRRQLAGENFIGNGSSMLMHREVFDVVGGFDAELRAKGAQGCEDYMFAMAAAQHFPFRCVPRRLVGYRIMRGNMSSDAEKMVRSYELVVERFAREMADYRDEFVDHHRNFLLWHAQRAAMEGARKRAILMMRRLQQDHAFASSSLWLELVGFYIKALLTPRWLKDCVARMGLISRPRYQDGTW
ncbi:glycosyltransferase [Aurantiacibacter xanthus]|uniref:Glycosyltransferase n=1 Tax=Aurantiacibacter xanthus TaxID=1784712 RepID=A0A3A1P2A7_9SPHN|nr:glycosyltransferase family 2 protein [Aurantiacibacter xanthus]RIV82338.1 glycosyltransferase [Aurantiacibacter xanthus]